jgi:hypothetical protein
MDFIGHWGFGHWSFVDVTNPKGFEFEKGNLK